MALRQAIQIKDLNTAISEDLPIVLMTPKIEENALSNVFGQQAGNQPVSAENARMTKLSDWERPPRQNGKKYGHIETENWQDFEDKLKHILKKGNVGKLSIEYEGYITNLSNAMYSKETKDILTNALKNEEGGVSLFSAPDLKISFLKLAFDRDKNLCVSLPYLDDKNDDLKRVYLHTPDMNKAPTEEYHDRFDHINLA